MCFLDLPHRARIPQITSLPHSVSQHTSFFLRFVLIPAAILILLFSHLTSFSTFTTTPLVTHDPRNTVSPFVHHPQPPDQITNARTSTSTSHATSLQYADGASAHSHSDLTRKGMPGRRATIIDQKQKDLGTMKHTATAAAPSFVIKPIQRRDNPSAEDFNRMAGNAFANSPFVFENTVTSDMDPEEWTRDGIRRTCGHRSIFTRSPETCTKELSDPCHYVRVSDPSLAGKTWAALKVADLTPLHVYTVSDFLDVQDTKRPDTYIHDASISAFCPELLTLFKAPKYFPTDLHLISHAPNPDLTEYTPAHPSVFIGKKGTMSRLHSDNAMSRFWLMQMSGSKLVRMVPPSENWRGGVEDSDRFQPVLFDADLMFPDFEAHPDMKDMLVYETTLRAGELLFIPAGWAHQVLNLEDSVATSKNFVDTESAQLHFRALIEDVKMSKKPLKNSQLVPMAQSHLTAFYLPLILPSETKDNIPWHQFQSSHYLELANLPQSVIDFVKRKSLPIAPTAAVTKNGASSHEELQSSHPPETWIDDYGRSPMFVAVEHNFVAVVRYLVEVGMPVNMLDASGYTPLAIAIDSGYKQLGFYLISKGAIEIRPPG